MATTFEKLNLQTQKHILVLNAPSSFESQINTLDGVQVSKALSEISSLEFALAFVTQQTQVDNIVPQLIAKAPGDAILWFAYPKQTSKRYKCEFNRDNGWDPLKQAGYDTVRAVAIDEDWSALRFRRIEFIKNSIRR